MWTELAKILAHVAITNAVHERMQPGGGAQPPKPSRTPVRPSYAFWTFALLGYAGCCLSSTCFATFGALVEDANRRPAGAAGPAETIFSLLVCSVPAIGALFLAYREHLRVSRAKAIVALEARHGALTVDLVTTHLRIPAAEATALLSDAMLRGYIHGYSVAPRPGAPSPFSSASGMPHATPPVAQATTPAAAAAPKPAAVHAPKPAAAHAPKPPGATFDASPGTLAPAPLPGPIDFTPAPRPPSASKSRWLGRCAFCNYAGEQADEPRARQKCPNCRAPLTFTQLT